jgi:hypothetical protein
MKSLAYVVSSAMTDIGVSDERHYVRFLKWAVDGYRKMNLHGLMPTVKTVELDLDKATNSAPLPQDYIDYLKIGVCRNGYMINFDLNNKICLPADNAVAPCPCEPQVIEQALTDTSGVYLDYGYTWNYYNPHINNGIYTAGWYGVGAGFYGGGYRIDKNNNRVVFDSYVHADTIRMEYQSTGVSDDGTALVDEGAIESLTAWVNYQRCLFSKDVLDVKLIPLHKSNFENAAMSYNAINNARTPDFWIDLMRQDIHQAVKR